jgi:hypothetical protein
LDALHNALLSPTSRRQGDKRLRINALAHLCQFDGKFIDLVLVNVVLEWLSYASLPSV